MTDPHESIFDNASQQTSESDCVILKEREKRGGGIPIFE